MCTAMLYDPKDHYEPEETKEFFEEKTKVLERLINFKRWKFLQPFLKKEAGQQNADEIFFHFIFSILKTKPA